MSAPNFQSLDMRTLVFKIRNRTNSSEEIPTWDKVSLDFPRGLTRHGVLARMDQEELRKVFEADFSEIKNPPRGRRFYNLKFRFEAPSLDHTLRVDYSTLEGWQGGDVNVLEFFKVDHDREFSLMFIKNAGAPTIVRLKVSDGEGAFHFEECLLEDAIRDDPLSDVRSAFADKLQGKFVTSHDGIMEQANIFGIFRTF